MSEEFKPGILDVETILDSCVLAEGKRWYQVKWMPTWMTGEQVPAGVLETYKREEVTHAENDGVYRISAERKAAEDGPLEYFLCRGNTWESEDRLNSIDKSIVVNYWSQQSDLKEIVKIEEDFGDYGNKSTSADGLNENSHEDSSTDAEGPRISMVLNDGQYEALPCIKTEVFEDGDMCTMEDADDTLVIDTHRSDDDDYQCAKCNSLFITGKMKDFVSSNDKPKGYKKCQRCSETYCPRCSINMGELRHNGKTSLFCDKCIGNFATQSTSENTNNKVKDNNKQNLAHVMKAHKPTDVGFPSGNNTSGNNASIDFYCEICGKPFNRNSHHEFMFTGENSIQCGDCFKKHNQQPGVNNEAVSVNGNRFQYFMPVLYQSVNTTDANGFTDAAGGDQQMTGIRVLSGNHKDHVVHKGYLHFERTLQNEKSEKNEMPLKPDKIIQRGRPPNDKPYTQINEEEASVHQDEELDGGGKKQGGGDYKCYDCGRVFNRQYTLDTHRRIHTGEKPYTCEVCGERFRQSGTKLNHVRAVHTKERPFQCQYCGKTFSHKSSITVHIRIHTKEKPYQCQTCKRCFTDRATYLKHQSIHSGIKPYGCPMCTRKFSQKSNLKRHYKNIHELGKPDTPVPCPAVSADGVTVTDISDKPELSVMSSAMSEISAMPEYPPEFRPMLEIPITPDVLPEAMDSTISQSRVDSIPEYPPVSEYRPMSEQLSIVSDVIPEDMNTTIHEIKDTLKSPMSNTPKPMMVLAPTPI